MRKLLLLFVVALAVASLPTVRWVEAASAHPAITDTNFIIYKSGDGGGINQTTLVFPVSFSVSYRGEVDREVAGRWAPLDDPANYEYEVVGTDWSFVVAPRQVYEGGKGRYLLTYFVSVSAVPYATKYWWGWISERVKVVVSASVYVRIDKPPEEPIAVLLSEIMGVSPIPVAFDVEVERTRPISGRFWVSGSISLLNNYAIRFFRLTVHHVSVDLKGVSKYGSFNESNFIAITPLADMSVHMCLEKPAYFSRGDKPLVLEGKLIFRSQLGVSETLISLDSDKSPCGAFTLSNVVLQPGSYRGNNSLVLVFKSGAFEMSIKAETDVPGIMAVAATPTVVAMPEYSEGDGKYVWNVEVQIPVNVVTLWWGRVSVLASGYADIGGTRIDLSCEWADFSSPGVYRCRTRSVVPPYDPKKTYSGTASVTVQMRIDAVTHSDTAKVSVLLLTHTSIYYVVISIYRYLVYFLMFLTVASAALTILGSVFRIISVEGIVNPVGMLFTSSALLSIVALLPYLQGSILAGVCQLSPQEMWRAMECPIQVVGLSPEAAIARLFSYYDKLLSRIRTDYVLWVKGSMDAFTWRLIELGTVFTLLLGVALLLMLTMNAPVAGSIASVVVTFAFSLLSILTMLLPSIGLIMALASLTELMLTICCALLLVLLPLGVAMVISPLPGIQAYGENIVGASIFFLLLSPLLAPITYGLYAHVLRILDESVAVLVSQVVFLSIPLARAVTPPFDIIMRISGFVATCGIVLGMVVLAHIYILTRTGIMASIGESLAKLIRR